MRLGGKCIASGEAHGVALVLTQPLSFYGGVDVATGNIIDHSHPGLGLNITGKVLIMPGGRGSSSSSSVLAELIRRDTGPCAIVLGRPDPIMIVASLVAQMLYNKYCPIVVCDVAHINEGDPVKIGCEINGYANIEVGRAE